MSRVAGDFKLRRLRWIAREPRGRARWL